MHKVGWAPPDARAGDDVYIHSGGKTPFVLRKLTDLSYHKRFRLAGECIVEGVMHGEMCQAVKWDAALLPVTSWLGCGIGKSDVEQPLSEAPGAHLEDWTDYITQSYHTAYAHLQAYTKSAGLHLVSLV